MAQRERLQFTGISMGLFISSLVADGKMAANLVLLILIPRVIH